MRKTVTWVVVADGKRAAIFQNDGPSRGLTALPGHHYETELPPDRALRSDKPGRVFESADSARHGIAPTIDYHRQAKDRFVARIAGIVEHAAQQGEYDRLVVVAPPQALGELRAALGNNARTRLVGELNKDLTMLQPDEIAERIGDIIAV
ncbi:MAG: host attachment protein [Dongiaceae bacterium]